MGGSLTKIATFGTNHFVHYSRHVRYLGCQLLGGFTVFLFNKMNSLTLKRRNSFQNQKNRKARHSFARRPLIFKSQRNIFEIR